MLTIFQNPQFGEIRTALTESNEPLFCASDIARALGYVNPADAVRNHCKGVVVLETPTNGGVQPIKFIKEPDMYRLIMKSRVPSAEAFQDWVCEEVLPALRKTGEYRIASHPKQIDSSEMDMQMRFIELYSKGMNLNDASKHILYRQVADRVNLTLPSYVPSKGVLRSASECLAKIGSDISSKQFNKLLITAGYLTVNSRPSTTGKDKKFKTITEKGLMYGENQVYPNCPKETHPLWYEDKFEELYRNIVAV